MLNNIKKEENKDLYIGEKVEENKIKKIDKNEAIRQKYEMCKIKLGDQLCSYEHIIGDCKNSEIDQQKFYEIHKQRRRDEGIKNKWGYKNRTEEINDDSNNNENEIEKILPLTPQIAKMEQILKKSG